MPADARVVLPIGGQGLNLRSAPADLDPEELADSLNWQLDRSGALSKRLGVREWSVAAPAAILELMVLRISGGTTYILAHCKDGAVYSTTDGTLWTSIDSGLSTTVPVGWVQYNDKLYYCDGAAIWRDWDGTTKSTHANIPKGTACCLWRNRLWVALGRTVYWSKIGDPTDFTTYPLNTVTFPADTAITALVAIQNVVESPDGADGVIVFTENHMHRIYDDSDNTTGVLIGGANVLVDNAVGCVARRTIADLQGEIFFLARDGIYSSNGHGPARLESIPIEPLLRTLSWGQASSFVAANWKGRYLLAYAPQGAAANTRLLEVYTDFPRHATLQGGYRPSRRYGWFTFMAHDVPVTSFLVYEGTAGTTAYIAHANPGDEAYVRLLFTGGYDVSGASTQNAITASARTGALLLGSNLPKRLRRVDLFGKGAVTLSVSPDLESSAGESRLFDMRQTVRDWDTSDSWGVGVWGGGGGALNKSEFYTQRGRFLTFLLTESSTDSSQFDRTLGYAGAEAGGAAVYSAILKVTPLDADG